MYILGVTGNIGSGKTTVTQRLKSLGAAVSHSDDLAKKLLQNNDNILTQLSLRFGPDIMDHTGKLNRKTLAERAFANLADQQYLNQLIHPEVRKGTLKLIELARQAGKALFVIDAPLLFEAGAEKITQSVLVVAADHVYRQDRLEKRSQIAEKDFNRRDRLQMPITEKINRADHVIYNNESLDDLFVKVDELYKSLVLNNQT